MSSDLFELLSQGFRYWFVLLGLIIVWRAVKWTMQDHRSYQRILKTLPDAGLIGEIVNLGTGESHPLPREGVIGSGKACDVRLKGIRSRELEYIFVEGRGILITPAHRQHELILNGEEVRGKSFASHGYRLNLPGYSLRFRLFSGLNIPELTYDVTNQMDMEESREFEISPSAIPHPDQLPGLDESYLFPPAEQSEPFIYSKENVSLNINYADPYSQQPISLNPETTTDHQAWNPDMTWQYAVPPPELFSSSANESHQQPAHPVWEQEFPQLNQPRRRRSKRHDV